MEDRRASAGIATMLSGALAATAVVSCLCKRGDLPRVPTTLHIDLMEGRIKRTGPLRRRLIQTAMSVFFRRLERQDAERP